MRQSRAGFRKSAQFLVRVDPSCQGTRERLFANFRCGGALLYDDDLLAENLDFRKQPVYLRLPPGEDRGEPL